MVSQPQSALRILRRRQLEEKVGLSRSAIYDKINPKTKAYDASFPKPIQLGTGKNPPVGWVEAEVDAWLTRQIEQSRAAV